MYEHVIMHAEGNLKCSVYIILDFISRQVTVTAFSSSSHLIIK